MFDEKPLSINHKKISRATKTDYEQLATFLNQNPRIHRHLDWFTPLEWLGQQPFLLEKTNSQIQAVLCAVPENQEAAWIRFFGVRKNQKIDPLWEEMLNVAIQDLQINNVGLLATLSLHSWFKSLLGNSGFKHKQNILVLEWQGKLPDPGQKNQ